MKVNFVVVDSGPIIKGAILENFSKHAISVPGVIKEIKDVKTRQRMRNLPPYFFSIRSPSEQAIKHVISVSKETGDFKVLSKVDLEVLALAYEMKSMKTFDQIEQMFEKMNIDSEIESDEENEVAGKLKNNGQFEGESDSESLESLDVTDSEEEEEQEESFEDEEYNEQIIEATDFNRDDDFKIVEENVKVLTQSSSLDDNSGWITADNFEEMKSSNFGLIEGDTEQVSIDKLAEIPMVGCLTTDYAMQNILLKLDITILSVDGMVVKEPRIFVSWCRACFKKFKRTDIFFCPSCGNDNLGKIPAKIKENGEIELYLRKNFQPNLRNTKFSIPNPKGGKHRDGNSYIYCADQKLPHERKKKNQWTFDVNEEGNLPFMTHQVSAKSSILGISENREHCLKPSRPRGNRNRRLKK